MTEPLTLDADRALFATVTAEITTLERTLSLLRADQLRTQQRLDSYKYPVLTLPNEITSEIFLHFIPPLPAFPPLTGTSSPTILTQICRQWREIAISIPTLWTAISVGRTSRSALERRIAQLWLDRSSCCPLHIRITDKGCIELMPQCVAVIEQRARWEYLKVKLFDGILADLGPGGPMPLLRHLHMELGDDHPVLDVPPFAEVPRLRTAILDEFAALTISLPWARLTSLTLRECFLSTIASILQQTPSLIHCDLDLIYDPHIHVEPNKTLPHLRSLVISGNKPGIAYLETFTVPALSTLRIPESLLLPDPVASLTSFLRNSRCRLVDEVFIAGSNSISQATYKDAFPSVQFSFNQKPRA
ncbi:hypothetical protein C8R46DRAFT_1353820 [Mycena filopes]|nr:hypothetical protein C8R46DRAFT_1353820 [Mycena filopes]